MMYDLRPPVHKILYWKCEVCHAAGQAFCSATPKMEDTIDSVAAEIFGDIALEHTKLSPQCIIDDRHIQVLSVTNAPKVGIA